MLHPAIEVRQKGSVHGKGLFTKVFIPKVEVLWKLKDPVYSWRQIKTWSEEKRKAFKYYGFQCGVDRYSLPYGDSREANHSCNPNMVWADSNTLISRWNIQVGEELTYDYASCDITLPMKIDCDCGAKNCRGTITNLDY